MIYILFVASSYTICHGAVRNYVQNISRLRLNDVSSSALQGTVPPVLNVDIGCLLLSSLMVVGETLLPHRASEMSSARRRETPARYISMSASSTWFSLRRYCSMIAASKDTPLSRGIGTVNRSNY